MLLSFIKNAYDSSLSELQERILFSEASELRFQERILLQTRYCNFNLTSPRYNRETEGGRTFTVTTCKAWNSLSLPVRQKDSVDSLKKASRNEFFKQQQNLDHFSI